LRQREVFILRHWHGFSTAETAELLQLHEGTVKSHLKRGVETVKGALRRDGYGR
jgi:RNA polymerase sigma factor (sigma-70 family)